ncbi:MAG TPA: DUF488 domain-containing protein [Rhodanobacteraceae bacterium]|nr:DUF488 domain-containing protein [Rhodanobacteraceae bacterium]
MSIAIKRIYEDAAASDGKRVLVDRLWPRGVSKDKAALDEWCKDVAPSDDLRKWFGHDPDKWSEFRKRFIAELDANEDGWKPLLDMARKSKKLTLLFGARDETHNNAVVLKTYLEKRLS